jgi:hypothetical protein
MKIEIYNVFDPNATVELDLGESIRQALASTNRIIGHVKGIMPEIASRYVSALKKRLVDATHGPGVDATSFGLDDMSADLEHLKDDEELQNLVLQFVCQQLDLPKGFQLGPDKIKVASLNYFRSFRRPSYHRAKSCADVLGDERGVRLWKEIVARVLQEAKIQYEQDRQERIAQGQDEPTLAEARESSIKAWTESGMGDFTLAIFDDDKILYRFDSCLTHEALKDLDDPDWAYLCSCYVSDAPGFNFRNRYLRRTQTLHHGDFCDELYWDSSVYHEPEQPDLEFTRKLGKE